VTQGGEGSPAGGRDGADGARFDGARPGALGVEALLEVQRRGLRAAGELVDRLIRAVDGPHDGHLGGDGAGGPPGSPAAGAPGRSRSGSSGDPLADLVDLWADVTRRGLEMVGQAGGAAAAPSAAADDVTGGLTLAATGPTAVVRVGARRRRPGSTADDGAAPPATEVWLHNRGGDGRGPIALRCGPLVAPDGSVLPAAAVEFSPAVVDLPARSSRGVTVSVRADVDAPAGLYRGVVVASSEPDAWVALEVRVGGEVGGTDHGDDGR